MVTIVEIAKLQEDYKALVAAKKLSKKAICDLCVPFRDKAGITDSQTLQIARSELSLSATLKVCGIDKLYERIDNEEFMAAMSKLNFFRNCHYSDSSTTESYQLAQAINTVLSVVAKLIAKEE